MGVEKGTNEKQWT